MLEADVGQSAAAELLIADALESQDGHVGVALVQPAVVNGLHDCVADKSGAGGLIRVRGGVACAQVVQPHAVIP